MLGKGLESLIPKKDDSGDKPTPEDFNARISAGLSSAFSLTPKENNLPKVEPKVDPVAIPQVEVEVPPVVIHAPAAEPASKPQPNQELTLESIQPIAVSPEITTPSAPRLIEEKRYEKLLPTDAIFQIEV